MKHEISSSEQIARTLLNRRKTLPLFLELVSKGSLPESEITSVTKKNVARKLVDSLIKAGLIVRSSENILVVTPLGLEISGKLDRFLETTREEPLR